MKLTEEQIKAVEILTEEFKQNLIRSIINNTTLIINSAKGDETLKNYFDIVCEYYHIRPEMAMSNSSRKKVYRNARQIVWYLLTTGATKMPYSLQRIGMLTDEKKPFDHSTVRHGRVTVEETIQFSPELRHDIEQILRRLGMSLSKEGKYWIPRRNETAINEAA